jgi:hypothetical protein
MAGSRWIRLDVDYFHNPKVLTAGRDGRDLHLASICWVGRYLTDGHIPAEAFDQIAHDAGLDKRQRGRALDGSINAGLWVPNGHGFELHDFTVMNGTRAEVDRERDAWRDRQRRYRSRQGESESR